MVYFLKCTITINALKYIINQLEKLEAAKAALLV